jgi:hypothetical protein
VAVGLDLEGQSAGVARVSLGGLAVSGGGVRVGEVDEQACAGTDELGGHPVEGVFEVGDGFGVAEVSEGVATPALQVAVTEEQER